MNIDNQSVYLDANFLIYWAFPQNNDIKKRVRFILAQILSSKNVATSCLAIDEMWWQVKQTYNHLNGTSLGCADQPILSLLEKFTKRLLARINLLQFLDSKKGVELAFENIKQLRLKPRDAFHLSIMKENDFDIIVTNDRDFQSIKEQAKIKVIF